MIETQNDMTRRLAEHLAEGFGVEEAADVYLSEIDVADLVQMVRPLVVLRAKMIARSTVRRIEQRAFVSAAGHVRGTAPEEMRRLLDESFTLGDGEWVRWADATPAQHRARAVYLRGLAGSVVVTAERHEKAAAMIESAGAQNLAGVRDLSEIAA